MSIYCLKCNNNKKNIGLRKVTMTNKVIRAKSNVLLVWPINHNS